MKMAKKKEAQITLKDLAKGDVVYMKGFTGMKLGEFPVIAANAKAVKIQKKDGTQMTFSKETGKQTDAKNEKYANSISLDPADAPAPKEDKKADKKAGKNKKKEEKEDKKSDKSAKGGKGKKAEEPEEEDGDFEDEDFEDELDDEEEDDDDFEE